MTPQASWTCPAQASLKILISEHALSRARIICGGSSRRLDQARNPGEVRKEINPESIGAIRYENAPKERRLREDRVKQYKANLDELVEQRKIEARVKRAQSDLETAADTGVVGSPLQQERRGAYQNGRSTMLLSGERKVADKNLADHLQRQIAREHELKKVRKNPVRYDEFKEHHPFSSGQLHRDEYRKVRCAL